jgi:hypothetical protein
LLLQCPEEGSFFWGVNEPFRLDLLHGEKGLRELFWKVYLALGAASILLLGKEVSWQFAAIDLDERDLASGLAESMSPIDSVHLS